MLEGNFFFCVSSLEENNSSPKMNLNQKLIRVVLLSTLGHGNVNSNMNGYIKH